jgi:hypothetical protein
MGLQAIEAKPKDGNAAFLVDENTGDMIAGHRTASRGVLLRTGGPLGLSATSRRPRFKTLGGLRHVVARVSVTVAVCVLWLCVGVLWDNGLCGERDRAQKAAQVPRSAPVQTLAKGHQWDRAEALARQLSSVRADLDDAWISGSGAVDALAGEISSFRADLDMVPVVGSKTGQSTEAETRHRQALDQERDGATALARELGSLRAKLDAAWIISSEAVEAAEVEVKQALEQERLRADALARELGSVRAEPGAARNGGQEAVQTAAAEAEQKQVLKRERDRAEAVGRELTSVRAELDTARAAGLEAARTAEAAKVGQERALKEESDKTEKLAGELASVRKEADARSALLAAARAEVLEATEKNKAMAAEQKLALASEHDRADTLARELTSVRAELDTARASGVEAVPTAEAAKTGQERALKKELEKTETLTRELASARKEAEARSALLAAAHAEVLQVMQASEATAAKQKLALARERHRAAPLARELASVRNELETAKRQIAALNEHAPPLTVDNSLPRIAEPSSKKIEETVSKKIEEKASPPKLISGKAVASVPQQSSASELRRPEPPSTAPEAASDLARKVAMRTVQSTPARAASGSSADEQRLLARADTLLRQADISGARPLLERALERGSAQAAFMLAETYDARVLQSWRARGISGDLAKARELYERAQAGGIEDAKERIRSLQ